ncbi:MAG TPA: deoxyguanosinetriphosphate triphosphohydrolase [Chloroflexota bacterium]|jgi:dGTPase|nr:deoxyguanosinetriphosphate triphosphohydrolase [Chloroflexota bacterium]
MTQCPDIRAQLEKIEAQVLSPRAAHSSRSKGRTLPEEPSLVRTEYQRDRDRVIHCRAFRRLKHKTQVFMSPVGDHYVTRLTHTLQVAQIGRTIARALRLNEDLTEAIVLAHDLGHAPFGHAGEAILQRLNPEGFSHTVQSFRVVEFLEKDGKGLNLTWEVKDGILGHSKPRESISASYGYDAATLEGQIVKFADSIAYINHDIDDAIRAQVIQHAELPPGPLALLGSGHGQRINTMVCDVIASSIDAEQVQMSAPVLAASDELREWMFSHVYTDSLAKGEDDRAENMLTVLYEHFHRNPEQLPPLYQQNPRGESLDRRLTDYLAGMTDTFAIRIFQDIYVPRLWSVV